MTPRYKLRTLLILLAVLPPLLAFGWWAWQLWRTPRSGFSDRLIQIRVPIHSVAALQPKAPAKAGE